MSNQSTFWSQYGSTQSTGSRYENGRPIPMTMAILMNLHTSGVVSDVQLSKAKSAVEAAAKRLAKSKSNTIDATNVEVVVG